MQKRGAILVTGASRGIGKAIATTLSNGGWPIISWARSEQTFAETFSGQSIQTQCVDITEPESISRAVKELQSSGISLQGLVLNAGSGRWRSVSDETLETWRHSQAVNLEGHFLTTQALLPLMNTAEGATILGVLSDSALYPFAQRSAYASAKAGLKMFLDTLRLEVRHSGIRVSLIFPSRVDTYFQGTNAYSEPGKRQGALTSEEVASTADFIFSQPAHVEIRELHLGSNKCSYGPYQEQVAS